jgi:flagellar biosynthetic protein FliP
MSRRCEARAGWRIYGHLAVVVFAAAAIVAISGAGPAGDEPGSGGPLDRKASDSSPGRKTTAPHPTNGAEPVRINRPAELEGPGLALLPVPSLDRRDVTRTLQTVAIFGLISLAPVGLLMATAFVRINVVVILLRQALGSPQGPGNQVLTALALLLTALVMRPLGETVYRTAVAPYAAGRLSAGDAWAAGTQPVKAFMVDQIVWTRHQDYLRVLQEYAIPPSPGQVVSAPVRAQDYPLRVVAPAFLLSELTTALLIGFYIYLPFLVIDLVVSSVLAATGMFMLPPALVATPVKLIVFVLADGWLLIATVLLSSFTASPGGP